MKIQINVTQPDDWNLGFLRCSGCDEDGEFSMFSIGLLFFTIDFMKYRK